MSTERGRPLPDPAECQRHAERMLSYALRAGADGAEVLVRDGRELEVKVRMGERLQSAFELPAERAG